LANIINGTDTGSGGLITTGDSSDELQLQTAETTALTITSGQQSAFIAGTAAAPAVTTTGDLNTGIYFPAADNIGFTTGGTIRGRWTTDGLCFGTDTAAANALDDYEEGIWTATLTPGTSGTITVNNATSVNRYTKIGQLVTITATIEVSSVSSPVGRLALGGLPFSQDSSSIGGQCVYNLALTGSPGGFYQIISGGATNLNLDIQTADGSNPSINGANFIQGTTNLRFIVFYRIA
jgi:hypothetical protein